MASQKTRFDGTMLVVGLGAVAHCYINILAKRIDMDWSKLICLDSVNVADRIPEDLRKAGARFVQAELTEENYATVLSGLVKKGDMLCNLSVLNSKDMCMWCVKNDVMYMDTSREEWHEDTRVQISDRTDRTALTLYSLHVEMAKELSEWRQANPGRQESTAVLCHGMNPGMVEHFAKRGILDIARKILADKPNDERCAKIREFMAANDYAHLAQIVGIKTIHISERDTQICSNPKRPGEFVNTWSIHGFVEESCMYSELAYGSHEKYVPTDAYFWDVGPKNMIALASKGGKTRARSWVPSGPTIGLVLSHDEVYALSDYLTIRGANGEVEYRPTVHFVYLPCDLAMASLHEFEMTGWKWPEKTRVLTEAELISGRDEVGVLLMGHDFTSWWVGSRLAVDDARTLVKGCNATTLQVGCSALACVDWMVRNPHAGVCYPEQLPSEEMIEIARPWMEPVVSLQSEWTPLKDRQALSLFDYQDMFGPYGNQPTSPCFPQPEDTWMFPTFLVDPIRIHKKTN